MDSRAQSGANLQPPSTGHIGFTVPRLDAAVDWYTSVLGCRPIAPPATLRSGLGHAGLSAASVFGEGFREACVAQLATGGRLPIELFEFRSQDGPTRPAFDYWPSGWVHVCVIEREIEALCARVEHHGGRRLTDVLEILPGRPFRMCYCQDPFGNVVEIYTHTHEQVYAQQPLVEAPAEGGEAA
jgi:catechol 2,3-dioxygenase-like lactoylglutathione lyase family enzyme